MKAKAKWIPLVVMVLGYLSSLLDPQITQAVAHWAIANPDLAATLLTMVGAVYHGLDHPLKKEG
jgi:hypothetical protein